MISRRDVLTGGVFGAAVGHAGDAAAQSDPRVADELSRLRRQNELVLAEVRQANSGCFTGTCDAVARVREAATLFLRSSHKYPDQIDVAPDVFTDLYDWHVRNRQPLTLGRLADGRYTLLFMFTTIVLRADATAGFISAPYDIR